jgi:predicted dithiol-disulfide oxidoreductase (DUF899 family)
MTQHAIGTRQEWLAARLELLDAEKEHTRRGDQLTRQRQQLPWVPIEKEYRFETEEGPASLRDLFRGRSQLLVHHMMFPGCPSCASMADGYSGFSVHLEHHDVAMATVSRYPIDALTAFRERMGWTVPYVSSLGSDFNFDFGVAYTDEEMANGPEHNMHRNWDHSATPASEFLPTRGSRARRISQGLHRHQRLRCGGRRRVPHILGLRPWRRRSLGHVPVA